MFYFCNHSIIFVELYLIAAKNNTMIGNVPNETTVNITNNITKSKQPKCKLSQSNKSDSLVISTYFIAQRLSVLLNIYYFKCLIL